MSEETQRHVKGREIQRRDQVELGSTTDQRLLDTSNGVVADSVIAGRGR